MTHEAVSVQRVRPHCLFSGSSVMNASFWHVKNIFVGLLEAVFQNTNCAPFSFNFFLVNINLKP